MRHLLSRYRVNARGATAIEYALIAGGVAIAIIVTVNTLGANLNANFFQQAAKIAPAS
jgi:pilus assembly protein Flp/PilA